MIKVLGWIVVIVLVYVVIRMIGVMLGFPA